MRLISGVHYLSPTAGIFNSYNIIAFQHMYNFRIVRSFYFSSVPLKNFLSSTALLTHTTNVLNTRNTDIWNISRFRTNYKLQSLRHNLPDILNRFKAVQHFSFKETHRYFVDLILLDESWIIYGVFPVSVVLPVSALMFLVVVCYVGGKTRSLSLYFVRLYVYLFKQLSVTAALY